MATFGSTPPRDPLAAMKLAISDLQLLHDDAMATLERPEDMWAYDDLWNSIRPTVERRDPISQARRDDAALPQTRFGDYPSD